MSNHITEQPLHKTIRQYRVVAISGIIFLGYMLVKCWNFFELNHQEMSAESAAGFFTLVAAILAAFNKCINNIQEKNEE